MGLKISDLVIFSDVDGTLITHDGTMPERNIEAIKRFKDKGGKFAICTGRAPKAAKQVAMQAGANFPCVVSNGGAVYDYGEDKYLMHSYITDRVVEYTKEIMDTFKDLGVFVIKNEYYYVRRHTGESGYIEARGEKTFPKANIDDLPLPWDKVIFTVNQHNKNEILDKLIARRFPDVYFLFTSDYLMEMLPMESDKKNAIESILAQKNMTWENAVAIGDYFNDLNMIKAANIGATTAEAPDSIQKASDFIAGPCEKGSVADLIEYLEKEYK